MKSEKLISWYASLSIIIGPILQPYNFLGKSMALVVMLANVVLFSLYTMFLNKRRILKPDSSYFLLLLYFLTVPILFGSLMYKVDYGASLRGLLVFSASLLLYASYADLSYLKNIYKFFVILAVGVFVAQELCFVFLGYRFAALIPFFELNYEMGMDNYVEYLLDRDRSSSFFLEPAHLSVFVLPYFIIKMVDNKLKGRLVSADVVLLTVFFIYLRSGLGFVCLLIIWLVFFFKSQISQQKRVSFIIGASFLFMVLLMVSDLGSYLYESFFIRTGEVFGKASNESGLIRITRGFLVYQDFPFICKVFGASNGAIDDVIRHSSVHKMFNEESYLNNLQKLLIGYGFIGVSLLCYYIHRISNKRNPYSSLILIVFIVICFMENMLFDGRMLLYFAIAAIPASRYLKIYKKNDKKSIYNY